jgi:Entner-Doudoroff aldolase
MKPAVFVERFKSEGVSAILRTSDAEAAEPAMESAVRGGFRVIEFTLSVPNVFKLISKFARQPDLVVGAGTVLTVEEARRAVDAGAQFLVSPVVDESVIGEADRLGVAAMPGCSTPTEMLRAYRAGAPLQKLFPEPGPGPAWVKQTLGPLPFLRIVPTSGVTLENVMHYFAAGAFAVGFVASLFPACEIAERHFDRIEARARKMIGTVKSLRHL